MWDAITVAMQSSVIGRWVAVATRVEIRLDVVLLMVDT